MTAPEFEARIVAWARAQSDIEALIQIGSRVQPNGIVDGWSDWDYQLISRQPGRYKNRNWPEQIAPCWSAHFERTERGVVKLSAVFEGGLESDFVLLPAWQIKLVCWAMRRPGAKRLFPTALRKGIHNLRLVAAPGYRVIIGGSAWENRYAAINAPWSDSVFSAEDFEYHVAAFWRHAVWVAKKILRGELRAAIRWSQVELHEHTLALLEEEARLLDRSPRFEARQAERWLSGTRLDQTASVLAPQKALLATALLAEIALFIDVSNVVCSWRGFVPGDYRALQDWLQRELSSIAS